MQRREVPPGGTEVDMMGIYMLLLSMTAVEARAWGGREFAASFHLYNGL